MSAQPATGEDKIYGQKRAAALLAGLCVKCGEAAGPKCHSETGRRNYALTGACDECCEDVSLVNGVSLPTGQSKCGLTEAQSTQSTNLLSK